MFARGATILSPYVAELKPESISQWVFIILMIAGVVVTSIIRDPKKNGVRQGTFNETDRKASWKELA